MLHDPFAAHNVARSVTEGVAARAVAEAQDRGTAAADRPKQPSGDLGPLGHGATDSMKLESLNLAIAASLFGCATAGSAPHDMSAAQHAAAAANHDVEASSHATEYQSAARETRARCIAPAASAGVGEFCWTSEINPTASHLAEVERHRRMAAEHRASSQALRDAEARACVGLRESERDMSPFAHGEDIATVAPLTVEVSQGRVLAPRIVGVTVVFRATPGMTAEWLQRTVDCHLARAASLGHEMPEMPYCPLVPRGASARVSSVGNGFAVAIRGDDEASVAEVRRRAAALVSAR